MTLLALALVASIPFQGSTLLPETPDDWRFERLDFPLSFAPDIRYEGFEELSFAPGMFEAESESYFSYVLDIRIEEPLDVDVAFLESFLQQYYRGLCAAVAEGRQLEIDLSKFGTRVEESERGFLATIDMVDAFVTGKPLRLSLELEVYSGPGTTELFGLASPKPKDAEIWKEMRAIRALWREDRPMPVFFNHAYVVPDTETYAALAGSEFLRGAFAVSEERKTVRRDMSYQGIYFYGADTYFEFLPPNATPELVQGSTGIAFGFETPGGTARAAKALETRGVQTFVGPITRELEGEALPWFEIMGIQQAHMSSRLNLFSLEYDPQFLSRWHADLPPNLPGIQRNRILERYAAKLGKVREEALFANVTGVHLVLDEAERGRFREVCEAFGYEVEAGADRWSCVGPGIRFRVDPAEGVGGVTALVMSLNRAVEREPLHLGKAVLSFSGHAATLTFGN